MEIKTARKKYFKIRRDQKYNTWLYFKNFLLAFLLKKGIIFEIILFKLDFKKKLPWSLMN